MLVQLARDREGTGEVLVRALRLRPSSGQFLSYGVFARTLRRAKLGGHRPYDLRHTFACLLLAEGVPLTHVAAQMGHANPTTTLRWYGRWIKGQGQRWVDVLDGPGANGRARAAAVVNPESAR